MSNVLRVNGMGNCCLSTRIPIIISNIKLQPAGFVEDASFIAIRINLGYTLPKNIMKKTVHVFMSIYNPCYFLL